ncbi:MAG: hypothetical protein HYT71_01445 [Candidatus Aenigmarchaeota archaeon]|nr:hypothetical protein [Candidatus Aenigmarchaeota archaeon]
MNNLFRKKLNQKMKGDVWYVSTFFFLVSLFSVTMIMLFSMSIARLIVGNLIDYTVHVSFLDFSLNTENALLSGMEIKMDPNDTSMKTILSNAAFQWSGDPGWDKNVFAGGKMYDAAQRSKDIFDKLVQGPYIFELRKQFDASDARRIIFAERNAESIKSDPEVAEMEFYLPYPACGGCSKIAVYRLYSTVK